MPTTLELTQIIFCIFVGFVGALGWFLHNKTSVDGGTFQRVISLFSATLLTGIISIILLQYLRWHFAALISFLVGAMAEIFIRLYMQYLTDSSTGGFLSFIRNMRTAYDVAKNATADEDPADKRTQR